MKVFVTGHRGYIGAHLVGLLKEAGHHVTGCDLDLFEGCGWEPLTTDRESPATCVSSHRARFEGFDCVMHLAAISNDPMGDLDPEITVTSMLGVRSRLPARQSRPVPRFLLSSSCLIYGKTEGRPLAEQGRAESGFGLCRIENRRRGRHRPFRR
jgi:nucleoside-diphosphate-sugar epimerase